MSYKQSEKRERVRARGIRSGIDRKDRAVVRYKDVPTTPVKVKVRDLEHFYRVVNLLNASIGKSKWSGPRKIVRQFRERERARIGMGGILPSDYKYDPIQITFLVPDNAVGELKLLLKFME
tara:strand:+ start:217 stop:579 length:363 start_codon:yes stop_codon:yes gene_type:complete